MSQHILTREELYAEVWSDPMVVVSARYGLSDRGLAKICTSRNIPVPPRGYWAKRAHGHRVKQAPLPPYQGKGDGRIYIQKDRTPPKPVQREPPDPPEITFERQPENMILVPERLGQAHPLVRKTREGLKELKPQDRGLVFAPANCLNIDVSPKSVPRALRIMQALLTALERRKFPVSIDVDKRITVATVLGERIAFRLIEKTKQVPAKPTDWRWDWVKKGISRRDPYDLEPSGVLRLELGERWHEQSVIDGKVLIEEQLNQFVVGLLRESFKEKRQRADREARAAAERERQRIREIEAEKARKEQERIDQWDQWMTAWKRAREVRAFARTVRRRLGAIREGSDAAEWLAWADGYAARLDRTWVADDDGTSPQKSDE